MSNLYTVKKINESANGNTYEVFVPNESVGGRGYVTRNSGDTTHVEYTAFVVKIENGMPVVVESKGEYTSNKAMSEDEVLKAITEARGTACRVDSVTVIKGGVYGIPVDIFNLIGQPIDRQ